ncbi:MAG: type III pantothenate kinase [Myxococcota bacterium]|jgi:type III pantothenate kinase|nr:type III pantothenate kinase [Myxococcota bacterium]OQC42854.1 MAG: Type III pantothenate kinase [Deltaproteobacteria bacterium ADurb.Bin058]HHW96705.1 type III pantothenate kinase [Oligoflexales bacterium]MBP8970974.1 type III pantothenate kinase [Myxococcota bacterium]HOE83081.1 type III pantothenate kinase [Myxococcota bacterium]
MLAAIDIGNTNIVIGIFDGDRLVSSFRIASRAETTADEYAATLDGLLRMANLAPKQVHHVCLASVVPRLQAVFVELSKRFFGQQPLIVGPGVKTGISISYETPRDVGADRIVNAVAARGLYKTDLIVVDFGTATTFDAITAGGEYLGGVIVAGVTVSLDALFLRTAKLPRVDVARPQSVIGRNTIHSIQSGAFYGYLSMVEGIVTRMKLEMKDPVHVIATGGMASLVCLECAVVDRIEPDLTMMGLKLIHNMNR